MTVICTGMIYASLKPIRRWCNGWVAPNYLTLSLMTGALGPVRLLDAPHTSENYLLKEMGYKIARKHARELRRIALLFGFAAPFLVTLGAVVLGATAAAACAVVAAASASAGVLVERWLFFAEAKHSVTLYYGARAA